MLPDLAVFRPVGLVLIALGRGKIVLGWYKICAALVNIWRDSKTLYVFYYISNGFMVLQGFLAKL